MIERLSCPGTHICWTPDHNPNPERVSLVRESDLIALENPPDPWSTDLQAAPLDKDVLLFVEESQEYFVGIAHGDGLFCIACDRYGEDIFVQPDKWREIPA